MIISGTDRESKLEWQYSFLSRAKTSLKNNGTFNKELVVVLRVHHHGGRA